MSHFFSTRFSLSFLMAASLGVSAGGVACSSSEDGSSNPTNVTGTGDGGSTSNADGGGVTDPDGSTSNPDGSTSSGPTKSGLVMLAQSTFMNTTSYTASASFSTTSGPAVVGGSCSTKTEGACQVTTCTPVDAGVVDAGDAGGDAGISSTIDSAGDVTFSGGKLASPVVLSPDSKNMYTPKNATTAAFAGGDEITVKAAGATVPAFESKANAPGDITVTTPVFTTFQTSFSKSQDLDVTWTGGGAGNVSVSIASAAAKTVSIICSFPANGGSGKVPSAAFTDLGNTGSIVISPSVTTQVKAGDYDITYLLTAGGASGSFTAN